MKELLTTFSDGHLAIQFKAVPACLCSPIQKNVSTSETKCLYKYSDQLPLLPVQLAYHPHEAVCLLCCLSYLHLRSKIPVEQ